MADGAVAQFGRPYELLCEAGGPLAELAGQTGAATRERLLELARQSYFNNINQEEPLGIDSVQTKL